MYRPLIVRFADGRYVSVVVLDNGWSLAAVDPLRQVLDVARAAYVKMYGMEPPTLARCAYYFA